MSRKNYEFCTNQTKKLPRIEPVQDLDVFDPETKSLVPSTSEELKKSFYKNVNFLPENSDTAVNVVYKMVYPDDLNLKGVILVAIQCNGDFEQEIKNLHQDIQRRAVQINSYQPAVGSQKSKRRRKKSKVQVKPSTPLSPQKAKAKVLSKTRSGREIKFPKHIENEFKRIEVNDGLPLDSMEVKLSDFEKYVDKGEQNKCEPQNKLFDQPDLLQKKRRIAAHYRCPKCKKTYLGRNKILKHLKKNPTHGPMHQNEENNFEVWNYLVNVTQKCPSSERGQKFCQELSNLLHNLLLLTNALFKKLGSAANEVKIDKVLGNAIGLTPGNYYFDDNNLYKNVTVLQLMANNDFLHSIKSKTDDLNLKSTILSDTNCNYEKRTSIDELVLKSMLIASDTNSAPSKQVNSDKILENKVNGTNGITSNLIGGSSIVPVDCTYKICDGQNIVNGVKNDVGLNGKELTQEQSYNKIVDAGSIGHKTFSGDEYFSSDINLNNFSVNDYEMKHPFNSQTNTSSNIKAEVIQQKLKQPSPKTKIQSNILRCPPRFFQKNVDYKSLVSQNVNNKNAINSELMTDSSVLISLPNLRVDELMLPVPSDHSNILDNSSSSDEVMNVDQFVNERFRKITE